MGGTAPGEGRNGMREHLVNFLDNFFLCGKSAEEFVTIKKRKTGCGATEERVF